MLKIVVGQIMSKVLLILEMGYCGWLVWTQFMSGRLALPAEQAAVVALAFGALHCLLGFFWLLRGEKTRAVYLITGLVVYGIFTARLFAQDLSRAIGLGLIGLALLVFQALATTFES